MLVPGFEAAQSPPVSDDLRMAATDQLAVKAPFAGVVVALSGEPGEPISAGAPVAVLEAMKMEHEVLAETGGVVAEQAVAIGDAVEEGQLLVRLEPGVTRRRRRGVRGRAGRHCADRGARRLRAVRERHEVGLDAARPDAVARRHEHGRRTARENLEDLVDEGSLVEYGPLLFAAQEQRRSREELIARTPADGLVGGVASTSTAQPCVAMSYDYTVLAGTQGMRNHAKKDRLFEVAERRRLPSCCSPRAAAGVRRCGHADRRRPRLPRLRAVRRV